MEKDQKVKVCVMDTVAGKEREKEQVSPLVRRKAERRATVKRRTIA